MVIKKNMDVDLLCMNEELKREILIDITTTARESGVCYSIPEFIIIYNNYYYYYLFFLFFIFFSMLYLINIYDGL